MGEGTQKDWVSEREESGKGNIGGFKSTRKFLRLRPSVV
jgi:hypothetical protein